MKRIGMITFHRAINNGAVLQAFALQKALLSLGCDARYIDYTATKIEQDYYVKPLFKRKSIKSIGVYLLIDLNVKMSQKKFRQFILQNLAIEECDLTNEDEVLARFDILLSGGDQIWNLNLTDNDTRYYLDFTDKIKKYSYGSSFGKIELSEEEKKKIVYYLNDYVKLFVREQTGKDIIQTLVKTECAVVPDPVFLLSKEEWTNRFDIDTKIVKRDYILFFELHENEAMREFANKVSLESGCRIFKITNDFFTVPNMKNVKRTGPVEFLNYIRNAKYVITDSFHASAFALIFNKQLFIGLKSGEYAHLNTRINNLVDKFSIQGQVISDNSDISVINYEKVNSIIDEERINGYKALKEIVG